MPLHILYWLLTAGIGAVHLKQIQLPIFFSIILSIIITAIAVFYLKKNLRLNILSLGVGWNVGLFVMQIGLLSIYLFTDSVWIALILILLSMAIEAIRIHYSNQAASTQAQIETHESEIQQMNETFRMVRAERHDFLKHISALHFMLEKHLYREANDYLDTLVDDYKETNLSIKGERGTVAAILHQIYREAKSKGIEIVYQLDVPISSLPINDQEMTGLLGNILSNSLEACEEWQHKTKQQGMITLQFYKRSGLYILTCKNHTMPLPNSVLDGLFDTYGRTTKNGDHEGLGTKIIRDTVISYNGFLDFIHKNEEFLLKIKIPAVMNN